MVYIIKIQQIGERGLARGRTALYEADSELEAIAVAAYEVDISRPSCQRIATVSHPSGRLVLAYVGRRATVAGDGRR